MTKDTTPKRSGGWLRDPKKPRTGETIGGGFFVFRRGDSSNRIRPANWPFEYASEADALREAERLAALMPGYEFQIVGVLRSVRVAVQSEEVAA